MTSNEDEKTLLHLRIPPETRAAIERIRNSRPWLSSLSHATIYLVERGLRATETDPGDRA